MADSHEQRTVTAGHGTIVSRCVAVGSADWTMTSRAPCLSAGLLRVVARDGPGHYCHFRSSFSTNVISYEIVCVEVKLHFKKT